MQTYRKKPVIVEAIQFVDDSPAMLRKLGEWLNPTIISYKTGKARVMIETLEGDMFANLGDYIIKGVNGELYPCKPDIFEKTYEKVEGETK